MNAQEQASHQKKGHRSNHKLLGLTLVNWLHIELLSRPAFLKVCSIIESLLHHECPEVGGTEASQHFIIDNGTINVCA